MISPLLAMCRVGLARGSLSLAVVRGSAAAGRPRPRPRTGGEASRLLLDEPFGALDAKVRKELRRWLRRLHEEVHVTTVFVTHDQEEAMEVADRIVVMNEGRIEQVGHPEEVYENPATPFVYNFLGNVNLFHGRVANGRADVAGTYWDAPDHPEAAERDAVAYARTYDVEKFDELGLSRGDRVFVEPRSAKVFPK